MSDVELDALGAVASALDGLSRDQAIRILEWAKRRYTEPTPRMEIADIQAMNKWMDGIAQVARQMKVAPIEVIKAAAATCMTDSTEADR